MSTLQLFESFVVRWWPYPILRRDGELSHFVSASREICTLQLRERPRVPQKQHLPTAALERQALKEVHPLIGNTAPCVGVGFERKVHSGRPSKGTAPRPSNRAAHSCVSPLRPCPYHAREGRFIRRPTCTFWASAAILRRGLREMAITQDSCASAKVRWPRSAGTSHALPIYVSLP